MRIYFATVFDATNVHSWSGLGYYIGEMLKNHGHEVIFLNNLKLPNRYFHKLKKYVMQKCFGITYSPYFSIRIAKNYARQIKKQVPSGALILSPNTILLSQLGKSYKKILFTDSTFDLLLNFYPSYSNISNQLKKEAQLIERTALQNADLLIYTSSWAANSARVSYNVPFKKIAIAPFGSNLDISLSPTELQSLIIKRSNEEEIHLILIAVAWYRKGGDYAIQVLNALLARGIKAKLHVIGIRKLPEHIDKTHIINHGFVSKATKEGQLQLAAIFQQAHYLILPSRADCTPVSVSEANSFGLPCLLSDVGGNAGIISKDINGNLFDFTLGPTECVDYITYLRDHPAIYQQLCWSSFDRYNEELNWETTGRKISALLKKIKLKKHLI